MTIVVVGLGQMGLPMAVNLLRSNERVIGVDISAARRELFEAAGGNARAEIDDDARGGEAAITILANATQVRDTYLGARGLIATMKPGATLIDCSTIDIATARLLQDEAARAGHPMIDAPISGGVAAAGEGSLSIMIGGVEEAFQRAAPILRHIGSTIIHAGGPGAGLAAKLCNNLVVGVTIGALSEAFAFGERLGLAPTTLFEIMSASTAQSWALRNVCPAPGLVPSAPSSNGYRPGGKTSILLKDLKLAADAMREAGVDGAIGAAAMALYQRLADEGGADLDCTAVFQLLSGRWPQEQ